MAFGDATVLALRARVTQYGGELFDRACDATVDETRTVVPVDTGASRDSIKIWNRAQSGSLFTAEIVAQGGAAFSDDGTQGPYIIRAKNAPMLVFFWPNGPRGPGTYFYRFVTHPGVRALHWFRQAMPDRWREAVANSK